MIGHLKKVSINIDIEEKSEEFGAIWFKQLNNNEQCFVVPLVFHVAIYVTDSDSVLIKDRYCMHNPKLAVLAITEYEETGVMRYWQKHHNKEISISGSSAYRSGDYDVEENKLFDVDWNMDEIRETYLPFINPDMPAEWR